jgi:PadR family transcriptional regulator, regulatory protein PadR
MWLDRTRPLTTRGRTGLARDYDRRIRSPYMLSAADREIRLGIWKIHILHHAASREVWGTWLLEELAEHGHTLSPGTLYPALIRMEKNRWLARSGDAPHPRARRAFRITAVGRQLLKSLRREVAELYGEVVLGQDPEHHRVQHGPGKGQRKRTPQPRRKNATRTMR